MVSAARRLWTFYRRVDRQFIEFMGRSGIRLLRVSLGLVFVWFGVLKLIGRSPVAELIGRTVYWAASPEVVVLVLGAVETAIGMGLLWRLALRLTLGLFWLLLAGTFLVLIVRPDVAFQQQNPLLLTIEGEFIVKNLVLISAGLVIGSTVPAVSGSPPVSRRDSSLRV